jgi:hypothetical protein
MLSDGGMDDTAIEENLGGIGDCIESRQGFFELLIVVVTERLDPSFYFLQSVNWRAHGSIIPNDPPA